MTITILVRNPEIKGEGCSIHYRDIGDYLKREEKLAIVNEAGSVAGIVDWRQITPDEHYDWIAQRDEAFQNFMPLGSKEAKAGMVDEAIFRLFSNGYYTGKDFYIYNFSSDACGLNAQSMADNYLSAMQVREEYPQRNIDDITKQFSKNIKWDATLKSRFQAGRSLSRLSLFGK